MSTFITANEIISITSRHGFVLCGAASTDPLPEFDRYLDWIKAGYQGTMHFLEDPKGMKSRSNPEQLFPGSMSVLVLGARYTIDRLTESPFPLSGRIASYAWGKDYHDVLQHRAELVMSDISDSLGKPVENFVAVDSSPILEKPLAKRARLGWTGNNSLLIHPRLGSFFFLTNILLKEKLDPIYNNLYGSCGTCHRCVDDCPTTCILPGGLLYARRCISYLTIEHRGIIPVELRKSMGNWIYGCTICQAVCPWNRKPGNNYVLPEFEAADERVIFPDLVEIVHLSDDEFKSRFSGTSLKRLKRSRLVRNAAVALGNSGQLDAVKPLGWLLENEPDPVIRCHAAWGLGQIRTSKARTILSVRLTREIDSSVQSEIRQALDLP